MVSNEIDHSDYVEPKSGNICYLFCVKRHTMHIGAHRPYIGYILYKWSTVYHIVAKCGTMHYSCLLPLLPLLSNEIDHCDCCEPKRGTSVYLFCLERHTMHIGAMTTTWRTSCLLYTLSMFSTRIDHWDYFELKIGKIVYLFCVKRHTVHIGAHRP